jgi:methionyl-tRNA formyltransferase
VKAAAAALGLEVTHRADDAVAVGADLGVGVADGQLVKRHVLEAVPMVNLHFSILPRWRGAAPVERALLAGDAETGVSIMGLDAGLDTGPVYARSVCAIGSHETAGELRARLVTSGSELLVATLPAVPTTTPIPQHGEPTYADKLTVEEFALDWELPADDLARIVRAGNPRPGAWTTDHGGRLKIWRVRALSAGIDAPPGTVFGHTRVATGDGALELIEVQPEGRRVMPANAWLAGRRAPSVLLGT